MNNDLLQKIAMLQQNQQQGPQSNIPNMPQYPMQNYDPISKGATEAMRSVRQSIQMDPQQSRRALGAAVFNMFANRPVPAPGSGLNGVLGSLSQGMTPAVEAYMKRQQQEEMMNHSIMKHNQELAHQQRREHFQTQELARHLLHDEMQSNYQNRALSESEAYHKALVAAKREKYGNAGKNSEEIRALVEAGILPSGSVPLSEITDKEFKKDYLKNARKMSNSLNLGIQNIENYDNIKKILTENPRMHNSIGRVAASLLQADPSSYMASLMKGLDEKNAAAAMAMQKSLSTIVLNNIEASGKAMTNIQKQEAINAQVKQFMDPETALKVIETQRREEVNRAKSSEKYNTALSYGAFIPERTERDLSVLHKAEGADSEGSENIQAQRAAAAQLSTEQIKQMLGK